MRGGRALASEPRSQPIVFWSESILTIYGKFLYRYFMSHSAHFFKLKILKNKNGATVWSFNPQLNTLIKYVFRVVCVRID
jgi:hypothetical protein